MCDLLAIDRQLAARLDVDFVAIEVDAHFTNRGGAFIAKGLEFAVDFDTVVAQQVIDVAGLAHDSVFLAFTADEMRVIP